MMFEQLPNLAAVMSLWSLSWSFYFFVMRPRGFDYERKFAWTALYFLSLACTTAGLFWKQIALYIWSVPPLVLLLLAFFCIAHLVAYHFLPRYIHIPETYFKTFPNRTYLSLNIFRLFSKTADILAQQVFILLLIVFLHNAGLGLVQTIFAFGILFSTLHIPLIMNEKGAWPSWLFSGIVFVFSALFPLLILTVPGGFVFAFMAHWSFYTLTAISFGMYNTLRPTTFPRVGSPSHQSKK